MKDEDKITTAEMPREQGTTNDDSLTLKWGTLKSWNLTSPKGRELIKRYHEIGSSFSAMAQRDTAEQKEIICHMIDVCSGDEIYLEWDGKYVSKDEAKKYVMEYGLPEREKTK